MLCAGLMADLRAATRLRHERYALAAASRSLSTLHSQISAARYARGLEGSHLIGVQGSLAATDNALGVTQQSLSSTNRTSFTQGLNIWTLSTCLAGVKDAFGHIASHDESMATQDISRVATACRTADGGSQGGLVYPFDFPDPFVLPYGGTTFAYATNSAEGNIQIIDSTDLSHWSAVGNALPTLPRWAAPNATWAPAVLPLGSRLVLYYSAVVAGPLGGEQCISAATATDPRGPFIDNSASPLVCQPDLGGSIDPSPFVDANGIPYLVWKSNGGGQPATLWSEPLSADGTALVGQAPTRLLQPDERWQGGVVEAPDLVLHGGHYLLFYSGNDWNSANYAIGMAACRGPLGPCGDTSAQPLLATGQAFAGPGGEDVFTDQSGVSWLAFHAWVPGAVGYPHSRALYLRQLTFTAEGSTGVARG